MYEMKGGEVRANRLYGVMKVHRFKVVLLLSIIRESVLVDPKSVTLVDSRPL